MGNLNLNKVKEVFYDIQEEGFYTHGLEADKIPEKITIDQASNPIIYPDIQPVLSRSIKKLMALGFTVVTHITVGAPDFVGSKTIGNKKRLLCSDGIPKEIDLKKYKVAPPTYAYSYSYVPPAKIFNVYLIEVFLDPPKKAKKGTSDKIKDFLGFNKEPETIEMDAEVETKPEPSAWEKKNNITPPTPEPEKSPFYRKPSLSQIVSDAWEDPKPSPWTPKPSKFMIYTAPSQTVYAYTLFITDQTKKYVFKLFDRPSNSVGRTLYREKEINSGQTVMNRVGLPNGEYYWEVWCGGIIVKEGKIRFS